MQWRASLVVGVLLIALGPGPLESIVGDLATASTARAQTPPCEIFLTEFTYDQRQEKYYAVVSLTESCQVGSIDPRLLDLQSGENIRFGDQTIPVTDRMVDFLLPTHQLQPTRKYKLAIRAFQPGSQTYLRRVSQSMSEDPLNFASQEFAYNPPQEVPIVWSVDGVRADFQNRTLQIALHHSDTPKPLQYEMVVVDRKSGSVIGRLERSSLALRNGLLDVPLFAAMEEADRAAEYQLTLRLFADRKLLGDRVKDFTLPAPPKPGPIEQTSLALQTHEWLRWSLAGIVLVLCLAWALKEFWPRKRKPMPRPQNLAAVFAPPPLALASSPAGSVAVSPAASVRMPSVPTGAAEGISNPESMPAQMTILQTVAASMLAPETIVQQSPPPTAPLLVITSRSGGNTTHLLDKREVTIGRAPDNDIIISDFAASRRHARITSDGDRYVWQDRDGVTRPSRVNGDIVGISHTLSNGDSIEVGQTVLIFQAAEASRAAATQPQTPTGPDTMVAEGSLRLLVAGVRYPLVSGTKLGPEVLGADGAENGDAPFAEVVANPTDPSVLELRNLTAAPWTVGLPTNQVMLVEPNNSVRLDKGVRIDFNGVEARVEA